jgi:GNAT superfamily N-acetyltransferase
MIKRLNSDGTTTFASSVSAMKIFDSMKCAIPAKRSPTTDVVSNTAKRYQVLYDAGGTRMILTFRSDVPIPETMGFEEIFEEELQLDEEEKSTLISQGMPVWMFVDGELAGETYGICLKHLDERIEDTDLEDGGTVYCYSTALLDKFRRKGLGPILKSYWLGKLRGLGYKKVVSHATSESAKKMAAMFGARFGAMHSKWFGTERTATFYWMDL